MTAWNWLALAALLLPGILCAEEKPLPVKLIFDTDIGNDVDDALALGMIHALQSRGECELIAVTITKDEKLSAPFTDAINTFYGRGDIPVGVVKNGPTREPSKFTVLAEQRDGEAERYPHDLRDGTQAPEATALLRRVLAAQPDQSVVIAQVGFSSNLARLLKSPADDTSPLTGWELAEKKVRLLSVMAGAFQPIDGKPFKEYNIVQDIPAAKTLVEHWPGPIVFSGFEIGIALPYPAESILQDYRYVTHHPLAEAYHLYEPPPHNRPSWDLTSVLHAVRPERGYFTLSEKGRVTVTDEGLTTFIPDNRGLHQYLTLTPAQQVRVTEALIQLSSQPPGKP